MRSEGGHPETKSNVDASLVLSTSEYIFLPGEDRLVRVPLLALTGEIVSEDSRSDCRFYFYIKNSPSITSNYNVC